MNIGRCVANSIASAFGSATFCAIFAFALPDQAEAATRWRVGGSACQPLGTLKDTWVVWSTYVVAITEGINSNSNYVMCPVPIGTDLAELDNTNGRKLDFVNVWMQMAGATEQVRVILYAGKWGGYDTCTCDSDIVTQAPGNFNRVMQLIGDADTLGCDTDCFGGAVPSNWALSVEVFLNEINAGTSSLYVLQLNAQTP